MDFQIKNVSFKLVHLRNMNSFSNVLSSNFNAVRIITKKCLLFCCVIFWLASTGNWPENTSWKMNILIMRWITLLPFSVKTTIKILILTIMRPHEGWVSAGLSEILKNTPVPRQCNLLWESELPMLRCYLKQQRILSMRFPRLSDMIISFISADFSINWKDIRQENIEK